MRSVVIAAPWSEDRSTRRSEFPSVWPKPDVADYLEGSFGADPLAVSPGERGWKDTVIANPGEVTRVAATFDLAGQYVWHCHILEHEDNEMMRPLVVQ